MKEALTAGSALFTADFKSRMPFAVQKHGSESVHVSENETCICAAGA